MKIAVVYNRESKRVINLFGLPNREEIGQAAIQRIVDALKKGKHQVRTFEGDKDLITNLEDFMPQVIQGERPGMVFNLSYGIQGQARYTHIPSILEMVGIPYVGSGPLAHSLSLDKVVTKMMLRQHNLPTPDFAVLDTPDFAIPELAYPLIVKPKNEAVSFGVCVVNSEAELRRAAEAIFEKFKQPVLAERYIEGREINVGLLGNSPVESFPPCEIVFDETGPRIYTYEDKKGRSGRQISVKCPTELSPEKAAEAQRLAIAAYKTLNCCDCARIDMRLDAEDNFYILEVNSLPSLGARGSYVRAAQEVGLDFTALVNRLVEVASTRYFGTPSPPALPGRKRSPADAVFTHVTKSRDRLEKMLQKWVQISSRSDDYVGIWGAFKKSSEVMAELGLAPVNQLTDENSVWTWQTKAGHIGGTLLIAHIDVPLTEQTPHAAFRREPEWIYGEGIASSRGPLAVQEIVLRALHSNRLLHKKKLGVLLYGDEGHHCRHSAAIIRRAAQAAGQVLVLRPSLSANSIITDHRGQRFYRFIAEGKINRIDRWFRREDVLRWASTKLQDFAILSASDKRLTVTILKVDTISYPMHLPHRITASILVSYANVDLADQVEQEMLQKLKGRHGFKCELTRVAERPPLRRWRHSQKLAAELIATAKKWDIELKEQTSAWPSVAGLVPTSVPVVCGLGPYARELYTPQEAINRLSLIQCSLLLASFLAEKS